MFRKRDSFWIASLIAIHSTVMPSASAQLPIDSVRRTPLVTVIEKAEKTVVALFAQDRNKTSMISGSGSIVSSSGYVLTNNHVVPSKDGFAVYDGKAIPFRIVGRLPERDIALIQLSGERTWPAATVGRNNDLMNGETVITAGNPGGRGVVFTAGIISNKSMMTNASNALAMTQFSPSDGRDRFIQFDAASNPGNSGGSLIDLESRLIGIVSGGFHQEQNVNYAIPIDQVRKSAMALLEPEMRHQRSTGIGIDPQSDVCKVTHVDADSSAQKAGLSVGDVIVGVNETRVRQVLDWNIVLDQTLRTNSKLHLEIQSNGLSKNLTIETTPTPPLEAEKLDATQPGLRYKLYSGAFTMLPNFGPMSMEQEGAVDQLLLSLVTKRGRENFAVIFDGYLDIKQEGLYRLTLSSDDGSRLLLHDRQWIVNDFNHPPKPMSRLARMTEGPQPISIQYYQATGGAELSLTLTRVDESTWDETPVNPIFVCKPK
jgi:S1-C subfamily serine protease